MVGAGIKRSRHVPVLLAECIEGLAIRPGGVYVDATGGAGGYAREIGKALGQGGTLLVMDQDPKAVGRLRDLFDREGICARPVRGNFRHSATLLAEYRGRLDGIVLDLGLSSDQIEDPERGFSFLKEGPLDMRMDEESELTAADIVNDWSEAKLAVLFSEYAEERHARPLARALVAERRSRPFTRTLELAEAIARSYARFYRNPSRRHPATRIFQALRMAVNDELGALREFLGTAPELLRIGGRLAVVSFHSLEDREVKNTFKNPAWKRITKKAIQASQEEITENPRSRSAKLRIAEWSGL